VKLWRLLENLEILKLNLIDVEWNIPGLAINSNEVKRGDIFFAIKGIEHDGNQYISDAIQNGAVCVISENMYCDLPSIQVLDVRIAMAIIAANMYGNVANLCKIIVVTGTNGKTTTTHMLQDIMSTAGYKTTLIGTRGAYINGECVYKGLTTPDPIVLHKIIKESYDLGIRIIIMELSAHAIYYNKLYGITPEIGVFTNLSQDHLDFFNTLDEYASVKISVFLNSNIRYAVVNIDDEVGINIYNARVNRGLLTTTYGIKNPADLFAMDVNTNQGIKCILNAYDEILEVNTDYHGLFNVYNILAATASARALSVSIDNIVNAYNKMTPVVGRFNIIPAQNRLVIIDYAHTPDGLKNLLITAKSMTKSSLILVFGCGGNRDKSKRGVMGAIACEYADHTIITEDNSRYEDINEITQDISSGFSSESNNFEIIIDRKEAIKRACLLSKEFDTILIAGKGDEDYLDTNGIKKAFSDKNTVEEMIRSYSL
jgi:UDP-N-acetylmuramoyl-L-alanyl-D-glutamate--2,6-diaminopimelate ligase